MNNKLQSVALGSLVFFGGIGSAHAAQYKVQSGDTLGEIANRNNIALADLVVDNPQIHDVNLIYPNQVVYIDESIPTPQTEVSAATGNVISLSDSEIGLLSKLIYAEANGESYEGKVAVGNVVLARMLDDQFPNTLSGVIYARNQFSVVHNGSINKAADTESINAAYEAVNRTNQGDNDMSLYFYNPSIVKQSWLQSRTHVKTIGNHAFKR